MRKILYSPGYGAGWSSWMQYDVPPKFACEYQPLIDALEHGDKLTEGHPAVLQFIKDVKEKFNADPYLGGLRDLTIYECSDDCLVRIHEYDGAESVDIMRESNYF